MTPSESSVSIDDTTGEAWIWRLAIILWIDYCEVRQVEWFCTEHWVYFPVGQSSFYLRISFIFRGRKKRFKNYNQKFRFDDWLLWIGCCSIVSMSKVIEKVFLDEWVCDVHGHWVYFPSDSWVSFRILFSFISFFFFFLLGRRNVLKITITTDDR